MKKNPQEEREESQQSERPVETKTGEVGNKTWRFLIYAIVLTGLVVLVYLITRYNNDTFKINM